METHQQKRNEQIGCFQIYFPAVEMSFYCSRKKQQHKERSNIKNENVDHKPQIRAHRIPSFVYRVSIYYFPDRLNNLQKKAWANAPQASGLLCIQVQHVFACVVSTVCANVMVSFHFAAVWASTHVRCAQFDVRTTFCFSSSRCSSFWYCHVQHLLKG